jgi:glycosyltransferase involved in cell wall biosynthesis
MKILFLNHNVARRGGTFYRAFHIARRLVRLGHSVTLLTISADRKWSAGTEIADGVEIVHTPDLLRGVGRSGWDPWDTLHRMATLRGREWNIIHAWDCRPAVILPALFARSCSRRINGKLVIDWCDWWGRGGVQSERPDSMFKRLYSPVETCFEEAFRAEADATTVASEALRQRALSLGVSAQNLLLLPGGADTETVRPLERDAARRALGLPERGWLVGYMGALPATEVDLLLGALHTARAHAPDLGFVAIGASVAGVGKTLPQYAGVHWADWMIDAGRVPFEQVGAWLAASDALALPMRDTICNRGRWPSKINDYLASGRPIVATRVGEIVDVLERHRAGLLTEPNSGAIARQLLRLRSEPDLAADLAVRGRRLAEGELSWTLLVARVARLYTDITQEVPEPAASPRASCSWANS